MTLQKMVINVNFGPQSLRLTRVQTSLLFDCLLTCFELSKTERSFDGLKNLIVKEQFINSCPKELAVHLREYTPEALEEMVKIADHYLEAHGKHVFSPGQNKPPTPPERDDNKKPPTDITLL